MTAAPPLTIVEVPIDDLRPDPANPRRISDAQIEALTRSLKEYGFVQPVLVRREDNTVIGGHQRLVAARRLGYKTVPVIYLDVSVEQARLLNLGLNKISGDWDQELLARLQADLNAAPDLDLTLSGFDDAEVSRLLKTLERREKRERQESFDLEAALEAARAAPRAKRGELWALGDHRLLCADACDIADVGRVFTSKAAMAFTDPPYNVALGDHGGQQRRSRRRRIQNDALPPEEWEWFCRRWSRNLFASVEGAIYICMSTKEWPLVPRVLAEEGGHWSDTIIWAKDRFVLGRADYSASTSRSGTAGGRGLSRRPRPGRRLAHRASLSLRSESDHETAGPRRACHREQLPSWRRRGRPVPWVRQHTDRRRAHWPRLLRPGDRPTLLHHRVGPVGAVHWQNGEEARMSQKDSQTMDLPSQRGRVSYVSAFVKREKVLQPLREFGAPLAVQIRPMPYIVVQTMLDASFPRGRQYSWKAQLSGPISAEVIDTMVEHFARVPSPFSALGFQQLGNAANRVRTDETAFSHRDALYDFLMLSGWEDPSQADVNVQWTRDLHEAVRPRLHAGIYVNGLSEDAAQQTVAAFRSSTYERLVDLKAKYDPTNFFRLNPNIRPRG